MMTSSTCCGTKLCRVLWGEIGLLRELDPTAGLNDYFFIDEYFFVFLSFAWIWCWKQGQVGPSESVLAWKHLFSSVATYFDINHLFVILFKGLLLCETMGTFGTYRYLSYLGHFWTIWAILDHFWPILNKSRKKLTQKISTKKWPKMT